MTSTLFPGIVFCIFFVVNFALVTERSSGAVPFGTLVTLLVLWFGISLPLVFLGAVLAKRAGAYDFPTKVRRIPHPVKSQRWYLSTPFVALIGGMLPFGSIFIEILFIMRSLWTLSTFYYMFGFLFLVAGILIITSAEISIVIAYFQLCAEDYRWWWRSFLVSGSSGIYFYAHTLFFLQFSLEFTRFSSFLIYLGYMWIAAMGLFLFAGATGFIATFMFVRKIYSLIKID